MPDVVRLPGCPLEHAEPFSGPHPVVTEVHVQTLEEMRPGFQDPCNAHNDGVGDDVRRGEREEFFAESSASSDDAEQPSGSRVREHVRPSSQGRRAFRGSNKLPAEQTQQAHATSADYVVSQAAGLATDLQHLAATGAYTLDALAVAACALVVPTSRSLVGVLAVSFPAERHSPLGATRSELGRTGGAMLRGELADPTKPIRHARLRAHVRPDGRVMSLVSRKEGSRSSGFRPSEIRARCSPR